MTTPRTGRVRVAAATTILGITPGCGAENSAVGIGVVRVWILLVEGENQGPAVLPHEGVDTDGDVVQAVGDSLLRRSARSARGLPRPDDVPLDAQAIDA